MVVAVDSTDRGEDDADSWSVAVVSADCGSFCTYLEGGLMSSVWPAVDGASDESDSMSLFAS